MSDLHERLAAALVGRYEIEREVGHGGMATVHLARDVRHGRQVALKVLRPELAQAIGAARFLREINIAAQLQSPHVLPLLDSGEANGLLYYVMPYVSGDSLRTRLATGGAMAPSEVVRLLRDVVDALATAHRHGVVHRDIKPDNVMIADRHAVVMDFGVAKAMSDASSGHDLTSIGFSLGTPAYMAPEQVAADPGIDHRADLYAVGVMAYEMLTGAPPFTGTPQQVMLAHISKAPVPLSDVKPQVPAALAQVVMRCLEKEVSARWQSADALLQALEALQTPVPGAFPAPANTATSRTRTLAMAALGAVAVAAAAYGMMSRRSGDGEEWVSTTGRPMLARLIEAGEVDSVFMTAMKIDSIAPRDSALAKLPIFMARKFTIASEPAGAKVYRASFNDTSRWWFVGTTPIDSVRLPARAGLYRIEKEGMRTLWVTTASPGRVQLDATTDPHPEMVRITGGTLGTFLVGTDGNAPVELGTFRLDRYEVSNREYKKFVDAGGYTDPKWWEPAIADGRTALSFAQAMARFVDRTGRPGPSTWEGGDYPAGQAEMPVGGVSWYEAKAHAKFAGKSLPTIYHWARAAAINSSRFIVPFSNLSGKGPLPVGTPRGVSAGGVSDMAGNVREWCENASGQDQHFILGGGWSDPAYSFVDAYAQPAMDRSAINGIRLALYEANEPHLADAARPIPRAFRDYTKERPVSDAVLAGFRPQFDYDRSPLDAKVELRDSTSDAWIAEKVSFNTAYGNERMSAWLFFPRQGKPPYQPSIGFPGSGVIGAAPFNGKTPDTRMTVVIPSGRVLVYPILKSTHERSDSLRSDVPNESIFWRDHVVMWVKDFRRTLDYLETRDDIDRTKMSYYGFSWGGNMAPIVLANEPRLKVAVLYVAGLTMEHMRPEVDPFNYLPHVTQPTIMLNGKYDFFFPSATSQEPFFKALGAPPANKRYIVYEGGHDVPRTQFIQESLAWLDKYLGPIRR